MNATNKVWLPGGLDEGYQQALSVPPPQGPMSLGLYLSLLSDKLQAMIDADPKAARAALQMSQDSAPGLWAIQEERPRSEWGSAVVQSDQAQALLNQINLQGTLADPEPTSLQEILELMA